MIISVLSWSFGLLLRATTYFVTADPQFDLEHLVKIQKMRGYDLKRHRQADLWPHFPVKLNVKIFEFAVKAKLDIGYLDVDIGYYDGKGQVYELK